MTTSTMSPLAALYKNFLGDTPNWYKINILLFLIINPFLFMIDPFIGGWFLIAEFIFTLAMALKCYPLLPGGLLAIEAIACKMTTVGHVLHEIESNLEVVLLLMFMVAGIHFIRHLLRFSFTQLLIKVRSKIAISLIFCSMAAFLSAFLDALTVLAVIITVCTGFYQVYHNTITSEKTPLNDNSNISEEQREDLDQFRTFLRSILMHAAVGTALGGICTLVGEPQNLIIGEKAGWDFVEFAVRVAPVSLPVLACGLITCVVVEKLKILGFGTTLPDNVYNILKKYSDEQLAKLTTQEKLSFTFQLIIAIWLIIGLALHLAPVGLIGLSVVILATVFTGVNKEGDIGKAFTESLPFLSLLSVFFSIVAVIMDQKLFDPVIHAVLSVDPETQLPLFYIANGVLSMVSDNVFVATVYINQIAEALANGTISHEQYNHLAIAINAGTNLPSVATPNGQAAFLFLLTSALAPLIRLSYGRMFIMAIPYTIVLSVVGYLCTTYVLPDVTEWLINSGYIPEHEIPAIGENASDIISIEAAHSHK